MNQVITNFVSIAGNTVIDIPLKGIDVPGPASFEFAGNVDIMKQPVTPLLGGCGASAAYVLGTLGQSVFLNSNIGKDSWGQLATHWLDSVGVKMCSTLHQDTAVHVIMLDGEGRRQSHYYLGEKVRWERSLHLDPPFVFFTSGYGAVDSDDLQQLCKVFSKLRGNGTNIVFDISPWFAGRVCRSLMVEVFKYVDYLIGTEDELRVWHEGKTLPVLAEKFLRSGVKYVVIKRGCRGAYGASQFGEEVNAMVIPSAQRYTVGAGDSFNGRLLFGICREETFSESVQQAANFATRIVNTARGALGAVNMSSLGD
jgi:sugar/nucleoside kinase (ribokinase family)